MIPASFDYTRPSSVEAAVSALADAGDDAKVITGGQSLLPLLRVRLAAPSVLVDCGRIEEMRGVSDEGSSLLIGAATTHHDVMHDPLVREHAGLLAAATATVADPQIRHRGTFGGSLAHADPAGDLPTVALALDCTMVVAGRSGRREVAAADFFLGPLESAVGAGELAVEAFFPAAPQGSGSAFVEVARRHGDYAVCGVAAVVTPARDRVHARLGYVSMGPTPAISKIDMPVPADPASPRSWNEAAEGAVGSLEPEGDIHATADYRLHMARVLTARALARAWSASAARRGEEAG